MNSAAPAPDPSEKITQLLSELVQGQTTVLQRITNLESQRAQRLGFPPKFQSKLHTGWKPYGILASVVKFIHSS